MTTPGGELFELCKQVYEATGWDDTESQFDGVGVITSKMKYLGAVPLYTSDYLLEKLPKGVSVSKNKKGMYGVWVVHREEDTFNESETPLKSLLKLTLKLHEGKIL